MSLRHKMLLMTVLILVGLLVTLYVVSQAILLNSFTELEERHMQRNVQRAQSAVTAEIEHLMMAVADWAYWDDTYRFVQDGNETFIDANLAPATLANLQLNAMIFLDSSGEIVYSMAYDPASGEETRLPQGFTDQLIPNGLLVSHDDIADHVGGILLLPEGPYIVASLPILTTEAQGPIAGTLLWARALDLQKVGEFAQTSHLSLTLYPLDDPSLPDDFRNARELLSDPEPILVRPLDGEAIGGYTLLSDIYGSRALILRVDVPREIVAQGNRTVFYFIVALVITGLIFTVAILVMLEQTVLSRLMGLSTRLRRIALTSDFMIRLPVSGNDELTQLAGAINRVLDVLNVSQNDLRRANDDLDRRVRERTAELARTNARLQEEVSERQRAETTLAEERNLLRTLIDNLPLSVFVKDTESRFVTINSAVLRSHGLKHEADILGKTDFDFFLPHLAERFWTDERQIIESGREKISYEEPFLAMNGEQRWLLTTKLPLRNSRGSIAGIVGMVLDITDRKRAEEQRQQQLAFLQVLIDAIPNPVFYKDAIGSYTGCNRAFEEYVGRHRDQLIGKMPMDTSPGPLGDEHRQSDLQLLQNGGSQVVESEIIHSDGTRRNVIYYKAAFYNPDGSIGGIVGSILDISDRKLAEEALAQERNLLRTLIDAVPDYIFIKDTEARLVISNVAHACYHLGAANPDSVIGKTDLELFPSELAEGYHADDMRVMQQGEPLLNIEELSIDLAGNPEWHLTNKVPLRDSQGRVVGLVGVARDITKRREMEEALRRARDELELRVDERTAELLEANAALKQEIAERQRAEKQLVVSEERYRLISELMSDYAYAFLVDPGGESTPEWVTEAFSRISGYTLDEVIERGGWMSLVYHEDMLGVFRRVDKLLVGEPAVDEYRIVTKGGAVRWIRDHAHPIWDEAQDRVTRVYGACQDITERKQAEDALAQERYLLRTLIDNLPDYVFVKDTESHFLLCNTALGQLYGLDSQDETIGKSDFDFYPFDLAERYYADEQSIMRTGQPLIDIEEPGLDVTGALRWHLTTKVPLRDKYGRIFGMVGTSRDITERKRAEEVLRQSEAAEREMRVLAEALRDTAATLTSVLDVQQVMTLILESVGRVVPHDASNIMLIEGSTAHAVLWRGYADESHGFFENTLFPLDYGSYLDMLQTKKAMLIPDTNEYPCWPPAPETAWVRSYVAAPIRIRDSIIGFLNLDSATPGFFTQAHVERLQIFADQAAIAIDNANLYAEIRRHADELEHRVQERTADLKREQAQLMAILDAMNDAVIVADLGGRMVLMNPVARAWLENETLRDDLERRIVRLSRRSAESLEEYTDVLEADDRTFQAKAAKVVETGRESVVVVVLRDITQMKEVDRLKSKFVHNVSHELRTPLSNIKLYLTLLEKGRMDRRDEYLDVMHRETTRLERLITDLLDLSRLESMRHIRRRVEIDLDELIRLVKENNAAQALNRRVTVRYESQTQPIPPLLADRDQIIQMLTNLIANAIAYTPEGGEILVRSAEGILPDRSPAAVVEVIDNGIGIPQEDVEHIFERFHRGSNVKDGHIPGTGLGLAITKEIVDLHYGTIQVQSEVNRGSTFRVTLPFNAPEPAAADSVLEGGMTNDE